MMGRTHALSGAVAMLAALPLIEQEVPELMPVGGFEIAGAAVVAAGAALLPDLDHDDSTVSEAFGPVTEGLSRVVRRISGGHRGATHSLLFAALCAVGGYYAGAAGQWWAWAPIVLLAGLGFCAVGVTNTATAVLASAGLTAVAVYFGDAGLEWLGPAIAIGVTAHLVGDCLTGHGCRLLWPFGGRVCVQLVDTGGKFETLLIAPALIAGLALLGAHTAEVWPFEPGV